MSPPRQQCIVNPLSPGKPRVVTVEDDEPIPFPRERRKPNPYVRFGVPIALVAGATTLAVIGVGGGEPPVFSKLTLNEAMRDAAGSSRLVVVSFNASWCGPCREMKRETWTDPRVEDWVTTNATAVLVDIDRHGEVAMAYGVRAVPTVLILSGERVVDRMVGYQSASELMARLQAAERLRPTLPKQ